MENENLISNDDQFHDNAYERLKQLNKFALKECAEDPITFSLALGLAVCVSMSVWAVIASQ